LKEEGEGGLSVIRDWRFARGEAKENHLLFNTGSLKRNWSRRKVLLIIVEFDLFFFLGKGTKPSKKR
jgi:hypothetical protein